jgi:hypothetical protein
MTSSDGELLDLLDKTEGNLKRIEILNKSFVCLSLNEWRYATRHIVQYMVSGVQEEKHKALGHLKRAYFDSCDILLDCMLNRISFLDDEIRGFANVVAPIVPDFDKSRIAIHAAKQAHFSAQSIPRDEREKAYDLLCGHCAELEKYLSNMDATKDIWQADIRKQMRRDRLPVIWTVIGIAVSIILAMIFG